MENRLIWVDQAKGLGIFLMIYAHNFPVTEAYIYTFHMPLFFFIAGMFHPKKTSKYTILHRFKTIMIPYFIWSILLFFFWLILGRYYGDSANLELNPIKNFIGIFYAQGDVAFMNWGIPMWFLPCIFMSFVLFSLVCLVKHKPIQYILLLSLILFGFIYPKISDFKLPWSIDIACVSLVFYSVGNIAKKALVNLSRKHVVVGLICFLAIHLTFVFLNSKVDMYRATYGNEILFIINGFSGTLLVILLFKLVKFHRALTYIGQHTIPLLALQVRAMTVIKFVLLVFGVTTFNFNEPEKFLLTFVQILLIIPVIILVNKYIPILDGKLKK